MFQPEFYVSIITEHADTAAVDITSVDIAAAVDNTPALDSNGMTTRQLSTCQQLTW